MFLNQHLIYNETIPTTPLEPLLDIGPYPLYNTSSLFDIMSDYDEGSVTINLYISPFDSGGMFIDFNTTNEEQYGISLDGDYFS